MNEVLVVFGPDKLSYTILSHGHRRRAAAGVLLDPSTHGRFPSGGRSRPCALLFFFRRERGRIA